MIRNFRTYFVRESITSEECHLFEHDTSDNRAKESPDLQQGVYSQLLVSTILPNALEKRYGPTNPVSLLYSEKPSNTFAIQSIISRHRGRWLVVSFAINKC